MVPFLGSRGHTMVRAVATSTTIGLPVSIFGAIVYSCQTSPVHTSTMLGYLFLAAFFGLSFGSVLAAPFGAKLASRVPTRVLRRGFAILLLVLAVKLLFECAIVQSDRELFPVCTETVTQHRLPKSFPQPLSEWAPEAAL